VPRVDPANRHCVQEEAERKEKRRYAAFMLRVKELEALDYQ
jgi:hypothetical protein